MNTYCLTDLEFLSSFKIKYLLKLLNESKGKQKEIKLLEHFITWQAPFVKQNITKKPWIQRALSPRTKTEELIIKNATRYLLNVSVDCFFKLIFKHWNKVSKLWIDENCSSAVLTTIKTTRAIQICYCSRLINLTSFP